MIIDPAIERREAQRTEKERYDCGMMSPGWLVIPFIIMMVAGVAMLIGMVSKKFEFHPVIYCVAGLMGAWAMVYNAHERWAQKIRAKENLRYARREPEPFPNPYLKDRIYMDSGIEWLFYLLAKTVIYVVDVAVAGVITIGLFFWLGHLSIAPTTIIIILLIIIIVNQEKAKR
jgi:amino acid transporter